MLIVIASVALVTIPAAGGIYYYAQKNMLVNESRTLTNETNALVASNTQKLEEYELSLKSLSHTLEKSLSAPPQVGEDLAFDHLIQRDPDQVWRNINKATDANLEAGIFLPPDAPLDKAQKILHLRSKHILDIFGASITSPTGNIWLLTQGKTEIIYDRLYPDFTRLMTADTDYTTTPWFTLGDPKTNIERGIRWTSPLFDPVSKSHVVSAILPVDVNGQWIGTVGRDLSLSKVLSTLFQHSQRYTGELHFLIDAQGNYIEAGPWQSLLEAQPENYKPDLHKEPDLFKLLNNPLSTQAQVFEREVYLQGRQYLAMGMMMQPVDWRYFRLIPVDEILAPMRQIFFSLVAMVLAIGLFIGTLIDAAVEKNIITRLKSLANTVRQYGAGDLNARTGMMGNDEIAKASLAFDTMADQLKATLDAIPDLLFELGLDGRYYAVHATNAHLLAAPPKELIGQNVQKMLTPDAANVVMSALREAHQTGYSQGKQFKREMPEGELWFELSVARKSSDNRDPRFIVLSRDITERKLFEDKLRDSQFRWKFAVEASGDGMWDTNEIERTISFSKTWLEMIGYSEHDTMNWIDEWEARIHPEDKANTLAKVQECLDGKTNTFISEYRFLCKDESYKWILDRGMLVSRTEDGKPLRMIGTSSDITARKLAEEEIRQLAFYDQLTCLPNRRLLLDRLKHALAASARSGQQGAVLFIDLDHFKTLNDTLGHDTGDLLLKQVAKRLVACVREGDTVARLGGDEFVVVLEGLSEHTVEAAAQVEAICDKILDVLNQTYQFSSYESPTPHEHHSTPSIGATLFSHQQTAIEELLQQADIAMYQAKKAGRNTLRFFDPQMQNTINTRAALENELRKALERKQLQLYYQVQVDTHQPIGAEALIRWLHPERGLVSPFHFIPLAEETGLILPIGLWVLDTACAQLKAWQQGVHTRDLSLSINVSAKQFHQADFVLQVINAVQRHQINPTLLKLELTESMLLERVEDTIATMNALKNIGIRFSLDDFGTGYSSLQYLKKLPLDQLKIDQSFVRDIAIDSSDLAIVSTVIAMAQTLNLNVIAEGVETEEQRQLLQTTGCINYQGYLFGRPVPVEQFEGLLREMGE